jgi:hypothetical protein
LAGITELDTTKSVYGINNLLNILLLYALFSSQFSGMPAHWIASPAGLPVQLNSYRGAGARLAKVAPALQIVRKHQRNAAQRNAAQHK